MKLERKANFYAPRGNSYWWQLKFSKSWLQEREAIKAIPGVVWNPVLLQWLFPTELLGPVKAAMKHWGKKCIINMGAAAPFKFKAELPEGLHPYQVDYIKTVIQKRRHMAIFATGLGKTRAALVACEADDRLATLFITRGMVTRHIVAQVREWTTYDVVELISGHSVEHYAETAREIARMDMQGDESKYKELEHIPPAAVTVISYGLLKHLVEMGFRWDSIIFDELHYLKTDTSARHEAAKVLLAEQLEPNALVQGLSATPIETEFEDFFHQGDLLWPGRWGHFQPVFCKRYGKYEASEYAETGVSLAGLTDDPALRAELATRIAAVATRATKKEWGHLLPRLQYNTIRIRPKRSDTNKLRLRELDEQLI